MPRTKRTLCCQFFNIMFVFRNKQWSFSGQKLHAKSSLGTKKETGGLPIANKCLFSTFFRDEGNKKSLLKAKELEGFQSSSQGPR